MLLLDTCPEIEQDSFSRTCAGYPLQPKQPCGLLGDVQPFGEDDVSQQPFPGPLADPTLQPIQPIIIGLRRYVCLDATIFLEPISLLRTFKMG